MVLSLGIEEEIKILPKDIDINNIRLAIEELGSQFMDLVIEHDTYYIHPCLDLWTRDEALRLRKRVSKIYGEKRYILTYKGKRIFKNGIKSREEIEVYVSDHEAMNTILRKMGFTVFAVVVKERIIYKYRDSRISIDNVKDLGVYVEIEGSSKTIHDILRKIRFNYDIIEKTYLELLVAMRNGS